MDEKKEPGDGTFSQYEEWCRVQYQMAHHDVWWPKGQQMKAGTSTLVLLGAIVGASKLLWMPADATTPARDAIPVEGVIMLSVLSFVAIALGVAYAWNLYFTMVRARARAKKIARLVADEYKVLAGALEDPERNIEFPILITVVEVVALSVVLVYFWG